jgi:hypothetical protein
MKGMVASGGNPQDESAIALDNGLLAKEFLMEFL